MCVSRQLHRIATRSAVLNLGPGLFDDTIGILHRASVFADDAAREVYFNQTAKVFWLSPPADQRAVPYGMPVLREEGSGNPEQGIPGLLDAVNTLESSVIR